MITSILIKDIFELAFDDFQDGDVYRQQIPYLTIGEVEHTGVGLFVILNKDAEIYKYSAQNAEKVILNGVVMINEHLDILADAIVHIENGIIDCVEIWNMSGNDYPKDEPINYELKQMWLDDTKRRVIRR